MSWIQPPGHQSAAAPRSSDCCILLHQAQIVCSFPTIPCSAPSVLVIVICCRPRCPRRRRYLLVFLVLFFVLFLMQVFFFFTLHHFTDYNVYALSKCFWSFFLFLFVFVLLFACFFVCLFCFKVKISPRRKEGRVEKKSVQRARGRTRDLPRARRGSQLHATGVAWTSKPFLGPR